MHHAAEVLQKQMLRVLDLPNSGCVVKLYEPSPTPILYVAHSGPISNVCILSKYIVVFL